jgi:hypothetical protein
MKSKKSHEGYLLIDHTFSPGVPDSMLLPGVVTAPAGKKLEAATLTCKHCEKQLIVNLLRTRARGYCPNCDHYICDQCEAIRLLNGCQSIDRVMEDIREENARNLNIGEL